MSIQAILFDLDGTLLPMDQDVFAGSYFKALCKCYASLGYPVEPFMEGVKTGIAAMVKNDGSRTNEEAFWAKLIACLGEKAWQDKPHLDEFYRTDFQALQSVCGYAPEAAEILSFLKKAGKTVVLATNPLFPSDATESRVRWAGLNKADLSLITSYENIGYSKPNPRYYREIADRLRLAPEECLMVGNDVREDMIAEQIGMKVFLLTDCLINKDELPIDRYPNGDFAVLRRYLETVI